MDSPNYRFGELDIGINVGLGLAAGVGDGAEMGRANGLGVFPDGAGLKIMGARLPNVAPGLEFGLG